MPTRRWNVLTSAHPTPLFYQSAGVAVGSGGGIFVADSGDHRIARFTPDGRPLPSWGSDVPGPLYFAGPQAIAVDSSSNVYVADGSLIKLSSSGQPVRRWSTGSISGASGVAVDRQGTIYALTVRRQIEGNIPNDVIVTKISHTERVESAWHFPIRAAADDRLVSVSIAVTPAGDVLLSRWGEHHCHDCDGTYYSLQAISPAGKILYTVATPAGGGGIAADAAGNVYLAAAHRIFKRSSSGHALGAWGISGCGPQAFGSDLWLATGPAGRLVVADSQPVAIGPSHIVAPLRAGVLHVSGLDGSHALLVGSCPAFAPKVFGQAESIALSPGGQIYVSDLGYELVRTVSPTGVPGGRFGAVTLTSFVATGSRGGVYVDDPRHDGLERHLPTGQLALHFGSGPFTSASIDVRGIVYAVSDFGYVAVYNAHGAPVRSWWLKGFTRSEGGESPMGVTVDGHGDVYVADTRHNDIQKFSSSGRLLAIWGRHKGSAPELFFRPRGVAVDSADHVYVLDFNRNNIKEFDQSGRLLTVLGRQGQGPGQFNDPRAIAIDNLGRLYVADNGNDRIQVLSPD